MLKYLFIILLFITSCRPKINDKDIAPTDSINKPELDDMTTLVQPEAISSRMKLQWQGEVTTSEVNIAIKDFIELGQILNDNKMPSAKHNELAILNGLELNAMVESGTLVKVFGGQL